MFKMSAKLSLIRLDRLVLEERHDYVFDHAKLIQIACNIARCTPTPKTILTTGTKTSSMCNLGSSHHKMLINV